MSRRLNQLTVEVVTHRRRPERSHYELVIDGKLLRDHIEQATRERLDVVCPLGWTLEAHAQSYAARLLLLEPPELPSGRRELLVCPMCADLACGCIAAEIRRVEETYVWEQLRYETNYDSSIEAPFRMGGFVFAARDYEAALSSHAGRVGGTRFG